MTESEDTPRSYDKLPYGWTSRFLDPTDGITIMVTDGSHYSPPQTTTGHYLYATVSNLTPDGIDYDSCTRLAETEYKRMVNWGCKPAKGDVLFSKDGTVGIAAVYEDDVNVVLLSSIAIIRPQPGEIDSRYLRQFLSSSLLQNQLRALVGGTAIRRVVVRDIKRIRVPLPPHAEQRRIAEVLDTVDKTITQTKLLIEKLRAIKRGLLHDLLTRGIGDDGKVRNPERNPESFRGTRLGFMPRNWSILPLEEVCTDVVDCPHTTPKYGPEGYLVATTTHIRNQVFDDISAPRVDERQYVERTRRLVPRSGDLVFTREAPVGEAFVIPDGMTVCLGQRTVLLRPKPDTIMASYLLAQIYSRNVRFRVEELTAGTTNPHLNVGDVRAFEIPVPSPSEQERIIGPLESSSSRIQVEELYLSKLRSIKRGLMDDLLTGRVRVNLQQGNGRSGRERVKSRR